jgi:hypothetical protein
MTTIAFEFATRQCSQQNRTNAAAFGAEDGDFEIHMFKFQNWFSLDGMVISHG